jgi:hypothetical protein
MSANIGRLNLQSIALNVKFWPTFETNPWSGYKLTTMYNIIEICRFRNSVADLQGWSTSHGWLDTAADVSEDQLPYF